MPITCTPFTQVYGPLSIPGVTCQLWLDAADVTTITYGTGSNVASWRDKVNSYAAANSTAAYQPVYSQGTIRFNGFTSPSYLDISTLTIGSSAFSIFIVMQNTGPASGNASGSHFFWPLLGSSSGALSFTDWFNTNIQGINNNISFTLSKNQYYVISYTFGVTSNFEQLYANGTSIGTYQKASPYVASQYRLGTIDNTQTIVNFDGNIGEFIVYNTGLNATQRQSVEGYLAQKWGLTSQLPGGHPGLTQPLYSGKLYQANIPVSLSPVVYYNNPTTFAPGCQLWLDAADATTVTGTTTVTAWRDKSGRGYNLTPGAGTTSYASQGITIDSSYLYGAGAVDLTTFTFFIVAKNIGTTYNQPFFSARPNTTQTYDSIDGFGWYMDNGNQTRFFGNYGNNAGKWITITSLNTLVSGVYSVTGTRDGVFTQWNSGTQVGTVTHTTRTNTAQGFSVGGEWDGSVWRTYTNSGTIYEVIVYNTVLTDSQRQAVEGYLSKKWVLTANLPGTHIGLKSVYVNPTWLTTIPYGIYNPSSGIVATGGTITIANGYKTHTFTTVGTTSFIINGCSPAGATVQVLVVGGGGSGGACTGGGGGGGGATFISSMTLTSTSYSVLVGAGGVPLGSDPYPGSNGGNSSFNSFVGIGGGSGGIYQGGFTYGAGSNGGCGGGACGPSSAVGLALQTGGYAGGTAAAGGPGGGGGGMGSVGSNASLPLGASSWAAGNGGNGRSYTIGGTAYVVSAGGGGGSFNAGAGSVAGLGGTGGGGNGSISGVGSNATYYGGGGGGSCGGVQLPGGSGYQGVVVISYLFS